MPTTTGATREDNQSSLSVPIGAAANQTRLSPLPTTYQQQQQQQQSSLDTVSPSSSNPAISAQSWLLRLFQSDFFNAWIALAYLYKYPDSPGIQHYLCRRLLLEFPMDDVAFLLPQLCHQMIHFGHLCNAIELLLLDRCRHSQHLAILMTWYLEAYMHDLQQQLLLLNGTGAPVNGADAGSHATAATSPEHVLHAYQTCCRVLFKCQRFLLSSDHGQHAEGNGGSTSGQPSQQQQQRPDTHDESEGEEWWGGRRAGIYDPLLALDYTNHVRSSVAILQGHHHQQQPLGKQQALKSSATTVSTTRNTGNAFSGVIKENAGSALVGLGCMWAAMGQPQLASVGLDMAIQQGQCPPFTMANPLLMMQAFAQNGNQMQWAGESFGGRNSMGNTQGRESFGDQQLQQQSLLGNRRSQSADPLFHAGPGLHQQYGGGSPMMMAAPMPPIPGTGMLNGTPRRRSWLNRNKRHWAQLKQWASTISTKTPVPSPSLEDLHTGDAFSFRRFLVRTGSLRVLKPNMETGAKPIQGSAAGATVFTGSPSLQDAEDHDGEVSSSTVIVPLRSRHYFFTELQFINTLMQISERLVDVPRSGRLSGLRAELALLNHNFPASVCIPLWCHYLGSSCVDSKRGSAEDQLDSPGTNRHRHHKIVRIPPDEAVVLNSADRVPYLILVEVLEVMAGDHEDDDGELAALMAAGNGVGGSAHLQSGPALIETEMLVDTSAPALIEVGLEEPDAKSGSVILKEPSTQGNTSVYTSADAGFSPQYNSNSKTAPLLLDTSKAKSTPRLSVQAPLVSSPLDSGNEFMDRMRTAAIMLSQLSNSHIPIQPVQAQAIREKILKEMIALEDRRMMRVLKGEEERALEGDGEDVHMLESKIQGLIKEDPSALVFRETWESKESRIRQSSPFGHLPNWKLFSVIVKSGADLRQEQLACQLIREMKVIWEQEKVASVWVYYYRVMITSDSSGLIETVSNSISVHSLKKEAYAKKLNRSGQLFTLYDYYVREFGPVNSARFQQAQQAFLRSLAGYSLVTYILSIKDRHNGNILVDTKGHVIHIDFGFMLSNSPGAVGFEMAPFKLSQEYVDILGGTKSDLFKQFRDAFLQGFLALRKHADKIVLLVEMMQQGSKFPCFSNNPVAAIAALRDRFQLSLTEKQVEDFIDRLIVQSYNNMTSRLYDNFQYYSNGIL